MTTPSNLEIRATDGREYKIDDMVTIYISFSYFCEGCNICSPTIDEKELDFDFYGRRVYTVRCEHATACALMASKLTKDQYEDQDDEPLMEHEVFFGKE